MIISNQSTLTSSVIPLVFAFQVIMHNDSDVPMRLPDAMITNNNIVIFKSGGQFLEGRCSNQRSI